MDFIRRPRPKIEKTITVLNLEQLYPHNVSMYRIPPTEDITLQEFEDLALERLKLLRILEQAGSRNLRFLSDEWKENIISEMNREDIKGYARIIQNTASGKEADLQARRRDHISHYILRVAYCRSQDLQRWFVAREMEMFKYKFSTLTAGQIKEFLELNKLNYIPLTDEQKDEVKEGLYESTMGQSAGKVELMDFYKVHFTEVLDLVRGRRCFLKGGYAYVSSNDFVSIIAAKYQQELERGLLVAQRSLPETENDERLVHILKGIHTSYTGKDYSIDKGEKIPIESIDQLALKSFPLCMRSCHEIFRSKHHLKHFGRLQYGLFLKGIGLILEDAIKFFRDEFTRIMDMEKFEKGYAYNIRHSYGREGSMVKYTPFSCMKVIMQAVGPQDTHGCPFKTIEPVALKTKLTSYGLSAMHVQEITGFVAKGHYQLACSRYFEITHDTKLEQGINHPNQYFELSQTVMGNREPKANTPAGKNPRKIIKKEMNSNLMDGNDDELWNIAETQESQINQNTQNEVTKNEWDEDFDVSQVESMDF